MFLERSPNNLLGKTVRSKPQANLDAVKASIENLPIDFEGVEILGTGNWRFDRSSMGSVVLAAENSCVVKVPLGKIDQPAFDWAKCMQSSINHFSSVSPKTEVVISKADNDQPKPIIIQERVYGKCLCDTPLNNLLERNTLAGIKNILFKVRSWYQEKRSCDISGQDFVDNRITRIIKFFPFFSDNMMLDGEGKVWLVDNTMKDRSLNFKTTKQKIRDGLNILKIDISLTTVNLLMGLKLVQGFMHSEKRDKITTDRNAITNF